MPFDSIRLSKFQDEDEGERYTIYIVDTEQTGTPGPFMKSTDLLARDEALQILRETGCSEQLISALFAQADTAA